MRYKSFKLFNRTIKIVYDKNLLSEGMHGSSNQMLGMIKLHDEAPEFVLWHEIAHMILDTLNYDDLSKDEQLVDLLGQCLCQIHETLK